MTPIESPPKMRPPGAPMELECLAHRLPAVALEGVPAIG
jgi:hypothetical protein